MTYFFDLTSHFATELPCSSTPASKGALVYREATPRFVTWQLASVLGWLTREESQKGVRTEAVCVLGLGLGWESRLHGAVAIRRPGWKRVERPVRKSLRARRSEGPASARDRASREERSVLGSSRPRTEP